MTEQSERASVVIAEYLRRRDAGEAVDERQLLQSYPELNDELQRFFQNEALIDQLADLSPRSKQETVHAADAGDSVPARSEPLKELPAEFGRYRVLKILGQGAMGAVYLARDTALDRNVALKTPKLDATEDPELVERFEREARAAATLHHRNICPVFDVGEIDGVRYLTMAYIEGKPLAAFISGDRQLTERQVAITVRKLAQALAAAHAAGVVHRDLKPANVMVDKTGEPVIMDFGLARKLEGRESTRLTQVGTIMGSPAYMSPEQVSGNPDAVGPQSDIYSLGVVLFELLTAKLPFEGSIAAVIGQIVTADPPDLDEFRPGVDPRLQAICRKMMARSTDERYQSMQEAVDALSNVLRNRQTKAGRESASVAGSHPANAAESVTSTSEELAIFQQIAAAEEGSSIRVPLRQQTRRQSAADRGRSRDSWFRGLPPWQKWTAAGFAGLLLLSGVIILFKGGRMEVEEGSTVNITQDGEITRLEVTPPGGEPSPAANDVSPSGAVASSETSNVSGITTHAAGWTNLFNGQDLTGWKGRPDLWKWEGGELVGTTGPRGTNFNTVLCSDREYGDFELEFEVRLDQAQSNSGLQIRSEIIDAERLIAKGPQVDVGPGYWGCLYGEKSGGMLKKTDTKLAESVVRPNDYNAYAVRCVGQEVTIAINGTTLVDDEIPSLPSRGILGWQLHGGEPMTVRFRNMRIRELAPETSHGDGWTDLFNGNDFGGWVRYADGKPVTKGWVIDGDAIHLPANTGVGSRIGAGDIMTTGTYEDFELQFEWKVAASANSGVIYRVQTGEPQSYSSGPEYQILDDAGHRNGQKPQTSAASIYNIAAPTGKSLRPVGEWNTGRIVAQGNHLEHWLNGHKVVEIEIGSDPWNQAKARTQFRNSQLFGNVRKGHIVLQDHHDAVWFRNLRIRELVSDNSPADGWTDLFNGRDLTGWEVADALGSWQVENEALIVEGDDHGFLFSKQDYKDFELSLEYRLEPGANSGVYLRAPRNAASAKEAIEVAILDDNSLTPEQQEANPRIRSGALHGLAGPLVAAANPIGDWNTLLIHVEGRRLVVELNGQQVQSVDLDQLLKDNPGHAGLQRTSGRIALQHWDAPRVSFRNLRIRELSDDSVGAPPKGGGESFARREGAPGPAERTASVASASEILTSDRWAWSEPLEFLESRNDSPDLVVAAYQQLADTTDVCRVYEVGEPPHRDLMIMRKDDDAGWSAPLPVGDAINTPGDDASPCLSADGLTLIFESDRPGGQGETDLWMSQRSSHEDAFPTPVNLGPNVNSPETEGLAALSGDGLTLIFASSRTGSRGPSDLWVCRRESVNDQWSAAENLGETVNSNRRELSPLLTPDGLALLFVSDRRGGEGSTDVWLSTRSSVDGDWSHPVNLGAKVNTRKWDSAPWLSVDGRALLVNSEGRGQTLFRRVRVSDEGKTTSTSTNSDVAAEYADLLTGQWIPLMDELRKRAENLTNVTRTSDGDLEMEWTGFVID